LAFSRQAVIGGFGIRDDWLGDGVHEEGWYAKELSSR
jgi:hypothetical protein